MVHRFKYGGEWNIAESMGRWYGAELRESGLYDDVDVVIPVPLHPLKTLRRGYNQSRYIGAGIARELGVELCTDAVVRRRNNPSQARLKRGERWESVDNLFRVTKPERLRGKHILIVDDVLTTGATLYNCMLAIHTALPDARISFATLAVTQRISHI
jgi:ComF family protein